jgi:hypothetical protein
MARVDTKNGRAPDTKKLNLKRNRNYILVLKPDGKIVEQIERPESLAAVLKFLDRHTRSPVPHPALDAQPVIKLHFPKLQKLTKAAEKKIAENVIDLLLSSQINSASQPADFEGGVSRVQRNYRNSAGVPHLVVSFKKTQTFRTIGAEIKVTEVVIGLSPDKHRSLFTVDDRGRVVEHGDESLAKGKTLVQTIQSALQGMPTPKQ